MLPVDFRYDGRLCNPSVVGYSILVDKEILSSWIIGT